MKLLQFNHNATGIIHPFNDFAHCAKLTVNYLTNGNIALSGGSTFKNLFPHWIALSPNCTTSSFFPVDERVVPFDDPQSNWGTTYREFLQPIGRESDKYHFASYLETYKKLLKRHFKSEEPIFDVIFLGVGEDGHTASLFPGGDYLNDKLLLVLRTQSPKPPIQRITLAPRVLLHAKKVITIIAGSNKKKIVQEIINKNENLPLVKILSQRTDSLFYVEESLII